MLNIKQISFLSSRPFFRENWALVIAGGRGVCGEGKLREYERARITGLADLAGVTAGPKGVSQWFWWLTGVVEQMICLICLTWKWLGFTLQWAQPLFRFFWGPSFSDKLQTNPCVRNAEANLFSGRWVDCPARCFFHGQSWITNPCHIVEWQNGHTTIKSRKYRCQLLRRFHILMVGLPGTPYFPS